MSPRDRRGGSSGKPSLLDRLLIPIIVGISIALFAGGSSPWWFDDVFGENKTTTTIEPAPTTIEAVTTMIPTTFGPTSTTGGSTTTRSSLPARVTFVTVGLAGGSSEVFVTWDENTEPDVTHYLVYCSETADGDYEVVKYFDPDQDNDENAPAGRLGYVDSYDVANDEGCTSCFKVSAVNLQGREGLLSDPGCFNPNV